MTPDPAEYKFLQHCLRQSPTADSPIQGVSWLELARIAAAAVDTANLSCPLCGAEPWCNIDCKVCRVCSELESPNAD